MLNRKAKNEKDVLFILDNLRSEDIEESKFVYGEDWKNKSLTNIMKSDCHAVVGVDSITGTPVCIGGVTAIDNNSGVGVVWLLATNDVKNHKYSLLKELKKEFDNYDEKYWFLYNFIFYKNNLAKSWLKWLGFKFDLKNKYNSVTTSKFEFFYRIRKRKGLLI